MIQNAFNRRVLGIFALLLFSFSCTSNLDFNQVNTFKSTPVFVANFATFDAPASQFVIGGVQIPAGLVTSNFDVFRDAYFNQSLTEADFAFEFTNTINKAFTVNLYFADINNQPISAITIPFVIPACTTGTPIVVNTTQVFQTTRLDLLKTARKIGFLVTLGSPTLTSTSPGNLKLRSSATVYLTLQ